MDESTERDVKRETREGLKGHRKQKERVCFKTGPCGAIEGHFKRRP